MARISVSLRSRPLTSPVAANEKLGFKFSPQIDPNKSSIFISFQGGGDHEFTFDKIFGEATSQDEVFDHHSRVIEDAVDGYNACILAYGQTGAGKTYTMIGPQMTEKITDAGLVMKTAAFLFERSRQLCSKEQESGTASISIRLSVLEIYNEALVDLLREASTSGTNTSQPKSSAGNLRTRTLSGNTAVFSVPHSAANEKLSIVDTANGVLIPNLFVVPLTSEHDAFSYILDAHKNRIVAEHDLNSRSSRSHIVYTYYITRTRSLSPSTYGSARSSSGASSSGRTEEDVSVVQSKLHLVDLAGSERVEKTGSSGVVQKEATYINRSLTFLEQVVVALTQPNRDHVPYRSSKLTYFLKDSLGGNCKTHMIACVWPHENHAWETLSTLRFAMRMKNVENAPIRNSLLAREPVSASLVKQIDALKRELAMRDAVMGTPVMGPWQPELSAGEKKRIIQSACALVSNGSPPMSSTSSAAMQTSHSSSTAPDKNGVGIGASTSSIVISSLSHALFLVEALKAIVWEACDHEQSKVTAVCDRILEPLAPPSHFEYNSNDDDQPDDVNEVNDGSPAGSKQGKERDYPSSTSSVPNAESVAHSMQASELQDTDRNTASMNGSKVSFEMFIASEDAQVLREDYEDAKRAVIDAKQRQRQIVLFLNKTKEVIDKLKVSGGYDVHLHHDADIGVTETPTSPSVCGHGLQEAKYDYRLAAKELELCKDQIKEAESLKQRALESLLRAYKCANDSNYGNADTGAGADNDHT